MQRKGPMFAAYGKLVLFVVLNYMYMGLRALYWQLTGRAAVTKAMQSKYETSGHVMGIAARHILDLLFVPGMRNFVTYHLGYIHPHYVLSEDVSLMQITQTEAIFMEVKKSKEPIYSSYYSFYYNGQILTGVRIIRLPMKSFLRLADEVKPFKGKLIFVHNQGRCGSTLMTSIFEHTGRCLSIAEPHALNAACMQVHSGNIWTKEEGNRLLRATVKVICKHEMQEPILAYVIKPSGTNIAAAKHLHDALPDSIPLFLYRDPVAVAQSVCRLAEIQIGLKMMMYMLEFRIPNMAYYGLNGIGLIGTLFKGWNPKTATNLEFGYFLAMVTFKYREQLAEQGLDMIAIRYEDVRDEPRKMITKMLKMCGLPDSLAEPGMKAMKVDSQHATEFSAAKVRVLMPTPPQPDAAFYAERKQETERMGLPPPEVWIKNKNFRIRNSLIP